MIDFIKDYFPNINKEGYFFIAVFAIITLIFFSFSNALGWVGVVLTLWCIFFFRDPERFTPTQENIIVSPADGVVQRIVKDVELPKEISDTSEKMTRVSVFLDVFNVHVNRIPVSGVVKKLHYFHGKFFNASLDKASEHNERQFVLIETENGSQIGLVQIAGLIARRIICDLKEGEKVSTGNRYGIIRFGSRVDLYLPQSMNIKVIEGQTMIGAETVIADFEKAASVNK
ncbi:MAG: phosphatidylserine decarboxylase [Candidatus Midichloriaceae bacterium]|jgi:phosphatidylserine decarboxylase